MLLGEKKKKKVSPHSVQAHFFVYEEAKSLPLRFLHMKYETSGSKQALLFARSLPTTLS